MCLRGPAGGLPPKAGVPRTPTRVRTRVRVRGFPVKGEGGTGRRREGARAQTARQERVPHPWPQATSGETTSDRAGRRRLTPQEWVGSGRLPDGGVPVRSTWHVGGARVLDPGRRISDCTFREVQSWSLADGREAGSTRPSFGSRVKPDPRSYGANSRGNENPGEHRPRSTTLARAMLRRERTLEESKASKRACRPRARRARRGREGRGSGERACASVVPV